MVESKERKRHCIDNVDADIMTKARNSGLDIAKILERALLAEFKARCLG